MKTVRLILFVFFISLCIGCAATPKIKETASGRPEAIFRGQSVDEVKAKLIDRCESAGFVLEDSSQNHLSFYKAPTTGQEVAMKMLYGSSSDTSYRLKFSVIQKDQDTKVTANATAEVTNWFGKKERIEMSESSFNDIQKSLFDMGGE